MKPAALVLRGDARSLPLPDASVDLIVTSPPYYALRSYTDGGEHYAGQIGDEPTPQEYIANLIDCTREWVRVLKPSGSIWVNLGDKYAGSDPGRRDKESMLKLDHRMGRWGASALDRAGPTTPPRPKTWSAPHKSLMMLPERYRIAAVDQLGLIARAVVVWSKPNGLPESVTDRVRRSHEDWVHLVKSPRYYSAVDEIREQYSPNKPWGNRGTHKYPDGSGRRDSGALAVSAAWSASNEHPLGRLPGSVWEIPTEPLKVPAELGVDHFAAFPTEWPRRIILGWSPSGICTECGEGRRPVADSVKLTSRPGYNVRDQRMPGRQASGNQGREGRAGDYLRTITGETCACPEPTAPTKPSVVLDPFGGTGTTALVARALGRVGITVDRSADYCRLAQWRTSDPAQIAKALRVPAPPKPLEGQQSLFDGLGVAS